MDAARALQPVQGPVRVHVRAMAERGLWSAPWRREKMAPAVPMGVRGWRNAPQARREGTASVRGLREKIRRAVPDMQGAGKGNAPDSQATGLTDDLVSPEADRGNAPDTRGKAKGPERYQGVWETVRPTAAHTAGPTAGRKTLARARTGIRPWEGTEAEQAAAGRPGKQRQRTRQRQRLSTAAR